VHRQSRAGAWGDRQRRRQSRFQGFGAGGDYELEKLCEVLVD
jgi:hypothetical protein